MCCDPSAEILIGKLRRTLLVICDRSLLKSIALTIIALLLIGISTIPPSQAHAKEATRDASPDEVMTQLRGRLNLTEAQQSKIRPIIEESFTKRREILKSDTQDKQSIRTELQKLHWSTDIKLGAILTEEQMKEYQKFREEQRDKSPADQRQGKGKGSRSGGLHGF
jgi:Spy/CpxP family protein refolding chaperone